MSSKKSCFPDGVSQKSLRAGSTNLRPTPYGRKQSARYFEVEWRLLNQSRHLFIFVEGFAVHALT